MIRKCVGGPFAFLFLNLNNKSTLTFSIGQFKGFYADYKLTKKGKKIYSNNLLFWNEVK